MAINKFWTSEGCIPRIWQSSAKSTCVKTVPCMIIGSISGTELRASVRVKRAARKRIPDVAPPWGTPRVCIEGSPVPGSTVIKIWLRQRYEG